MKPAHIILLCLFTAAFYLLYSSSSSSSSSIFLTGRRSVEMSLPRHRNRYPKAKVVDESSSGKDSDENTGDEIVNYHIDYHGVTTHPTPTPKHPNP